jgi:4-amino-4-deoxy-L-arabinose transferase-like glycosyltransferase
VFSKLAALSGTIGAWLENRRSYLVLGAVIALVHWAYTLVVPMQEVASDAGSYDQLAVSMVLHRRYEVLGVPEAEYMPGYPLLLSFVYTVAGVRAYAAVLAVQSAMLGAAAVILGRAAHKLHGRVAAGLCVVAMGTMPAFFLYSTTLNAEIWVIFLISVFCLLLAHAEGLGLKGYAACGVTVGLLMITKPEMFLWLAAPGLLVLTGRGGDRRAAKLTLLVAGATLIWAPWFLRNWMAFGEIIPFSTASGRGLWLSAHKPVLTEVSAPEFQLAYARCHEFHTPKTIDACFGREARSMLAQHPGYYLATSAKRAISMFIGSHTEQAYVFSQSFAQARAAGAKHVVAVKLVLLAWHTSLAFAGLLGLFVGAMRRTPAYLAMAGCVVAKILVHALVIAAPRYSLQMMPFLLLGLVCLLPKSARPAAT